MDSSEYELKTFGELEPGDIIPDENGMPVVLRKAHDHHLPERMYELEFPDGTAIKASGNHLWYIEAENDILSHHDRCQRAKAMLSDMPAVLISGLEDLAVAEDEYEVTLLDMVDLFDYKITNPEDDFSEEAYYIVARVLESIGHIVEYTESREDLMTGEVVEVENEKLYDGRRAAQQLLALTGERKYRKKWPVIIGRVVDTDTLFARYPDAEIPSTNPRPTLLEKVFKR